MTALGRRQLQQHLKGRSIAQGLPRPGVEQPLDPPNLPVRHSGQVSLETALSHHAWIPEAVYAVTSASLDRSNEFDTPPGHFSFTRVPQETLYAEVSRVAKEDGDSFLLASPLKALADYVCVHKCDWNSARPVVESLRVEERALAGLDASAFDRLLADYASRRVRRFLKGFRKDLDR